MSTRAGWFNRLSFLFFGTRLASRIFYPAGKAFRNVLLKVLGIPYIGNLVRIDPGTSSTSTGGDTR